MSNDNIHDRGMKKWYGFLMPEHVAETKQMWIDSQKIKMPLFDEDRILEFEQLIRYAKDYNLYVDLSLFDDGFERKLFGYIRSIDQLKKEIKLITEEGIKIVRFDKILNVTVID
ncbi:YolD-like family protein [Heyndrickxia oleronia]|uniref:YolD-like family protein n=1 Tax=Heyndrickxia oleronia TaxID=38875 RepID=UPI00203D230E|nr:YolD-like family protein [Heyndrickxia oleronia]MCM3454387.1 YolD-like family protein [Heyndrickxia oleronia]